MGKMNKILYITALACITSFGTTKLQAQENITIIEESGCLDNLIELYIKKNLSNDNFPGFRIQIYNGNSRDKMTDIQQKFKRSFPEVETYLVYQAPYFKLRAGDFIEKIDANKFLMSIRKDYPSAFLVAEEVVIK